MAGKARSCKKIKVIIDWTQMLTYAPEVYECSGRGYEFDIRYRHKPMCEACHER